MNRSWVAVAVAVTALLASGVAAYLRGAFPAEVPADAPAYQPARLLHVLEAVDSKGRLNRERLQAHGEDLRDFVGSMAKFAPGTTPANFPDADARLAWALNAYLALTLEELLENGTAGSTFRSWPIGGERLTREALKRRMIDAVEDPRTALALFDGTGGSGVLEGAPFAAEGLEQQLNDAVRRFMSRKENVRLEGTAVHLSRALTERSDAFLKGVPADRRNLLQVVWAFLPESCEASYPGCDTRADLDRACGGHFEKCTIVPEAVDTSVPWATER